MEENEKRPTKKAVGQIVRSVIFLALCAAMLCGYTYVFRDKNEAEIVKPFYDEPKNSLDVVFIGSSHLMCGLLPMELYEEYGYCSYVFASSSQLLPQSYYQTRAALETQTPDLIVLDVGGAVYDAKYGAKSYAHVQTDNMRYTKTKVELIDDLFEKDERLPYFLNLIEFHSRWKNLDKRDFKPIVSHTRGAHISYDVTPIELPEVPEGTLEMSENAETYLRKTIELCRERNVPLMLINMPGVHAEEDYRKINSIRAIAGEYGLKYLDYMPLVDELGIDPETDFKDPYHLNAYGAYKATRYLGEYLGREFDIDKSHPESIEEKWKNDLALYRVDHPEGHCVR